MCLHDATVATTVAPTIVSSCKAMITCAIFACNNCTRNYILTRKAHIGYCGTKGADVPDKF